MSAVLRPLMFLLILLSASSALFAVPSTPDSDFADNGDGTVTHKITGLIWQRCSVGQTWDGKTCNGSASTPTYSEALKLTSSFAGKSDWRLPNIAELQTLVEREKYNPAINSTQFPNTPLLDYWSASPYVSNQNIAWNVGFSFGNVSDALKLSSSAVRMVRGGRVLTSLEEFTPISDFVDNSDGTVTHKTTGLIWQRCAVGQTWDGKTCLGTAENYSYDGALKLSSNLAGQSDWRVPSTNELVTLVDYKSSGPAINVTIFPNTPTTIGFWTSSFYAFASADAWSVFFNDGYVGNGVKDSSNAVRLVRGKQVFSAVVETPKPSSPTLASSSFVEPNNSPEQASPILVNDTPVRQLLTDLIDVDWFEFYGNSGGHYTIEIPQNSIGIAINPALQLYDANGKALTTLLTRTSSSQGIKVDVVVPVTGLFRIRVSNQAPLARSGDVDDYSYQLRIYLTDAPQQGLIKGNVLNSCNRAGINKAEVIALLNNGVADSTFTHKTGEFGLLLNPNQYQIKSVATDFLDNQQSVSVNQLENNLVEVNQSPKVNCKDYVTPKSDPVLEQQRAVAVYDDISGQLTVRDVIAGDFVYYAELQNIGNYRFQLGRVLRIPGTIHSQPGDYSFTTLLANLPTVFALGKTWKVQLKNQGENVFGLESAE